MGRTAQRANGSEGRLKAMRARPMNKVDEMVVEYLFRVAKRRAVLRRAQQGAKESASIDVYDARCRQSLEAEFTWLFDPRSIAGSHVDHRAPRRY
jgi:hypothetical protein